VLGAALQVNNQLLTIYRQWIVPLLSSGKVGSCAFLHVWFASEVH